MGNFTFEEINLMCIYNTGSHTGLIDSLREMRGELAPEETELRELTSILLRIIKACASIMEAIRPDNSSLSVNISSLTEIVSFSLTDRKSTRLNSSHSGESRMPSSA